MFCRKFSVLVNDKKKMEPTSSISKRQKIKNLRVITLPLSNEIIFVLGCAATAFLIRFSLISQYSVIEWDGVYYANLGERIISGDFYGGISAYWSPLYCFLIGISLETAAKSIIAHG